MENLFTEVLFNNTTNLDIKVRFQIPIETDFANEEFGPGETRTIGVNLKNIKSVFIQVYGDHGVEFKLNLKDAMNLQGAFIGSLNVKFSPVEFNGRANIILGLG